MNLIAGQLRERHVGRWVQIKSTRRKPGAKGVLTKMVRHTNPHAYGSRATWLTLTIGDVVRTVPWYHLVIVSRTDQPVAK